VVTHNLTITIKEADSEDERENDGYLFDNNNDGIYDSYHSNVTGNDTCVEKQENGSYLIDSDGDEHWDYLYDPQTKKLSWYPTPGQGTIQEGKTLLLLGSIIAIIAILFIIIILLTRKKLTRPSPPAEVIQPAGHERAAVKKTTIKKRGRPKKK
jgi:hypothetical protein